MLPERGFKLLLMYRLHRRERHAERAGLIAEELHRRLHGDGIDLAEERIDEIAVINLHLRSFRRLALKIELAHLVRVLRRDIGKHGDDTLAAERKNRDDLVVIAGVDIELLADMGCDAADLRNVP